ncbi:MoaD/ThiS family protein [Mycobacterium sp.]|uniref:MoaD/ThiS family protein n=1 Tax=Mycobacterium sp. TaxID=1785 RepID=UPI002B9234EB|nr:MoaD/ThiS family protein [Mycobacterium sp.]HME49404.1 MoaD/ThiS family protein [Mycobacterium sp.]
MTDLSTRLWVTVRYFAAARAAAGSEAQTLVLGPGATVSDLVGALGEANPRLAEVLTRCSYLCDEVAVRDTSMPLRSGQTIDVLPPFAGG